MIHLPPEASPTLCLAKAELERFAPQLQQLSLYVGPVDWAVDIQTSLGPHAAWSVVGIPHSHDAYRVTATSEGVLMTAHADGGCLNATYAFLEALGCRWPHPGQFVPGEAGVPTPLRLDGEPGYRIRGTAILGPTTTTEVQTLIEWSSRRRLNAIWVADVDGIDLEAIKAAVDVRAMRLTVGPLPDRATEGRCFQHSIGNPYSCTVNPSRFAAIAGGEVGHEPYADLTVLGRPANLATVIRQDLEDYFRESYRTFYLVHNGPLSWWTCGFNFDLYARTMWDLNTDPAEALVDFAGEDERVERSLGRAEEAAAVALPGCLSLDEGDRAAHRLVELLPVGSLERSLATCDWRTAVTLLEAMDPARLGRFGREVFLPLMVERITVEGATKR